MKDKTLKKNSFVAGAFITTLGIVISKILGIVYVIPFHAVIGEQGGALYGYAYTIYALFMSLATAGIPLAMSKIVSEYQTLGYYGAKKRAFVLGKKIALLLGLICFIILMFTAPLLAKAILGDLVGGNTVEDVTFVIRVISTAILVVPVLSIYRGYFEGHRFMSPPSISQVLEQIVRVLIIVVGSYTAIKIFKLNLTSAVGIALAGATVGALVSYIYLVDKRRKNKKKFDEKVRNVNEPIITNKMIFRKLAVYAIPFILIDIFKSLYNYVDMVTVVQGLVDIAKYSVSDAETIMSMLSTWSSKFNMIILSVSTGIIVSLIPNLTQSVVKKDKNDINKKINQALSILLFLMLPMTIGLSFLAEPVWMLFYGKSVYGASVLSYFIFVGLFMGLFTAAISIIQVLKDYKTVFVSLAVGVVLKVILNTSLIETFAKLGLPAYYGVITASLVAYSVSFIICLVVLHGKYKIDYEETVRNFLDILSGCMLMVVMLFLVKFVIPIVSANRIVNLFIILGYTIIGGIVYLFFMWKTKTIQNVFGNKLKGFIKK
ncbi:MAG: polysaccharide biosynthesis protein [Mycoplasmatota bacterium]|nr:polysaccharide biosynthesis protein [Mycoplasmatota bacterium]